MQGHYSGLLHDIPPINHMYSRFPVCSPSDFQALASLWGPYIRGLESRGVQPDLDLKPKPEAASVGTLIVREQFKDKFF